MLKNRFKSKGILLAAVYCLVASVIFNNQMIVKAAEVVLSNYMQNTISADTVSDDIYLKEVMTLNGNNSFVGVFGSKTDYKYYYGTSNDLVNWDLKSEYFSLVYGNGAFVGISNANGKHTMNYTTDGIVWQKGQLPDSINPYNVKYENGYFKLYAEDKEENTILLLSKDAITWYNVTNELPSGAKSENVIISNGKVYSLVGTSINGTGFRVQVADEINENTTSWSTIDALCKEGYGMRRNFSFDGKTVGIQLYSIAKYEKNNQVDENLYYVTTDFVNWSEKDWTQGDKSYYATNEPTSTQTYSVETDRKRFEAVEIQPYEDSQGMVYYVSSVVYSVNGSDWIREKVNIFVNGTKVSKEPSDNKNYSIPQNYEWARSGVEYSVGRNYISVWEIETMLPEASSRGDGLIFVMKSVNIPAPQNISGNFVPFEDINDYGSNYLIQRAKMLGLVNGRDGYSFNPSDSISRQDMMVMIYNILNYTGNIESDTDLIALQAYTDKDQVSDYAKLAVSSLIKAGVIQGSGETVNPKNNVTYAEIMVIAEKLNKFRVRE